MGTIKKAADAPKRMIDRMAKAASNVIDAIADVAENPSDVIDEPVRTTRRAARRAVRGRTQRRRR